MAMTKVWCERCGGHGTVWGRGVYGGSVRDACGQCNGKGYVERDMVELMPIGHAAGCYVYREECLPVGDDGEINMEFDTEQRTQWVTIANARIIASNLFRAADEAEGKR